MLFHFVLDILQYFDSIKPVLSSVLLLDQLMQNVRRPITSIVPLSYLNAALSNLLLQLAQQLTLEIDSLKASLLHFRAQVLHFSTPDF
jgi:hypothetical protein